MAYDDGYRFSIPYITLCAPRYGWAFQRPSGNASKNIAAAGTANCVITCRNYGKFLTKCIKSVLSQKPAFQGIIVVDDGSSDKTARVAKRFKRRGVQYVWVSFGNRNLAKNEGHRLLAPAAWTLFVDADNWLEKGFLRNALAQVDNPGVGVVFPTIQFRSVNGAKLNRVRAREVYQSAFEQRNIADTSSLVRKEAFEQVGWWDENVLFMEDWCLWLKVKRAGWQFRGSYKSVLNYRRHSEQVSKARKDMPETGMIHPIRDNALISIVTLFSGRMWALESYERFLRNLDWNKENLFVVAIDNSRNRDFTERLRSVLDSTGVKFTIIPCGERAVATVSSERFARDSKLRRAAEYQLAAHMSKLYSIARQYVPSASSYVWSIEDDIEPPTWALKKLVYGAFLYPKAGIVSGLTLSRFSNRMIAWNGSKSVVRPEFGDFKRITEVGLYCGLIPKSVWDSLVFRPGKGRFGWIAYDHVFCRDLRKLGRWVMVSGAVACKHWQEGGTWV